MPATARLNDLATRKRLLVAQADLHRAGVGVARTRLSGSCPAARGFASQHRWWLIGGSVRLLLIKLSRQKLLQRDCLMVAFFY